MIAPDIECADVWHPGTMTDAAALAYKLLEAQGRIAVQRIEVGRYSERVTVRYLADIPHEWVLELLGKAKHEIQEESKNGWGKSSVHPTTPEAGRGRNAMVV